METLLLSVAGAIILLLLAVIAYFMKRLIDKTDETSKKTDKNNELLVELTSSIALKNQTYDQNIQTITTNITKVQTDMGKLQACIEELTNKFTNHITEFHVTKKPKISGVR